MTKSSRRDVIGGFSALAFTACAGSVAATCFSQNSKVMTPIWRTPQELVRIGFNRSRVVMMNEAHNNPKRCIRTREVGISVLPTAHAAGARYLAMEALYPQGIATNANRDRKLPDPESIADRVFLTQPEMREFIHSALSLGWTLIPYEADLLEATKINDPMAQLIWRDEIQGRNLSNAVSKLDPDARALVWCGLNHLNHAPAGQYRPMGLQFADMSGIRPFAIDQTVTVSPGVQTRGAELVQMYESDLEKFGGTAGFLTEDGFGQYRNRDDVDAFILSTHNEME
ncbi:MAG: hypothetical protein ABI645_14405 [Pseudomonadota bacterium]